MSNFSNMKLFLMKSPTSALLGSGTVTVVDLLELKFNILKGKNGVFASLPAKKSTKDEKWYPEVKFLDKKIYEEFQQLVSMEYNNTTKSKSSKAAPAPKKEEDFNDGIPF